jgi:carbon monoxide dehydrogenase subunit G
VDIAGSYTFNATPDRVWTLLMDPAVLSSCIPGCERCEACGIDRFNVTITVGLAAITGTYNGTVLLTDLIPQTSYRLVVEGQGRPGFVKGSSEISLRAEGDRADGRCDRARRAASHQRCGQDDARPILRISASQMLEARC